MIDKRVGSIEVGKDADMVIYDAHPLSTMAKVEKVMIDGKVYFDRDADIAARPEHEKEKKALTTKAAEEQKKNAPAGGGFRRPSL